MFSYCSTTENRAYYIRQITCFLVLQDFFGEQQGGLASWKLVSVGVSSVPSREYLWVHKHAHLQERGGRRMVA